MAAVGGYTHLHMMGAGSGDGQGLGALHRCLSPASLRGQTSL